MLYGAIEGGGTKFVCAVGRSPTDVYDKVVISTSDPEATLGACVDFFDAAQLRFGKIAAMGFGCFGPLDIYIKSPTYGHIRATPKLGWSRVDLLRPLHAKLNVPIVIDTDVGAAALAEWRLGSGRGLGSIAYVTVGTGIGADVAPRDELKVRRMHPEMGHILVRRHPQDTFAGVCPFHGDCLEGLASGPAIYQRFGRELAGLPVGHEGWSMIGSYLGQLAAAMALMLPVEGIIFGGGVMANGFALPHIRTAAASALNGYLDPLSDAGALDRYITGSLLHGCAGIMGAFLHAESVRQNLHRQRVLSLLDPS